MDRPSFSAFELKANATYRVVTPFKDFDGVSHPVGESWRYQSRNYLPYHAGLTLNIDNADGQRSIRFQDYPEAQEDIINSFSDYVVEVEGSEGAIAIAVNLR